MAWELLGAEQRVPPPFGLPETTPEALATMQPRKQRARGGGTQPPLGALQPPAQASRQRRRCSQPPVPTPLRAQGGALRPGRPSTWVQRGLMGVVSGISMCPLEPPAFLLSPSPRLGFVSVEQQSRAEWREPTHAAPQTPLLGIAGGPGTWASGQRCTEWQSLPLRGQIG